VLAAVPEPAESDIVTRWPSGTGVTSMTLLVSRACWWLTLVTTWYTHVSPTATGNGIEPAATTEPGLPADVTVGVAVGVAAGVAPVVPVALEAAPAGLLDDAADDVPAAEPHPASTTTAAPEKTARVDVYLLLVMRTAQRVGGTSLEGPELTPSEPRPRRVPRAFRQLRTARARSP
jgi:hypothetical protein